MGVLNSCSYCHNLPNPNGQHLNQISVLHQEVLKQVDPKQIKNVPFFNNRKLTYLAYYLFSNRQKYIDNVYPYQDLVNYPKVRWKRVTEVFPQAKIHNDQSYDFEYDKLSLSAYHNATSFADAANRLKNEPNLLKEIFPHDDIASYGFYVVFLCLNGNVYERKEIIIDDFIPVNEDGQYLYGRPTNNLVWMILLEKVWAKVMKGYHYISELSSQQIYAESTGVPSDVLFEPHHQLRSMLYQFLPESSKYFKFTLTTETGVVFALWQSPNEYRGEKGGDFAEFVMEIIEVIDEMHSQRHAACCKMIENKLIVYKDSQKQFIDLKKGQYILHVFNRSVKQCVTNLVTHSTKQLFLRETSDDIGQKAKKAMIKKHYKSKHNSLVMAYSNPYLAVRYCQDMHRGILCVKNEKNTPVRISIDIEKKYSNQIYFEDLRGILSREKLIAPQNYFYCQFIHRSNEDLGRFYQIRVINN